MSGRLPRVLCQGGQQWPHRAIGVLLDTRCYARIAPKPRRIEDLYTKACVVAVVRAVRSARRARLETAERAAARDEDDPVPSPTRRADRREPS